ncbi:MAG: alpha/beta hydrolase [Opitutae bacterium]|nr:alpha/beta hydrolase [Opitutae bacterium]
MSAPTHASPAAATVVLLHGLGLGGWAMALLARQLRRAGFRTCNLTYPSRTLPLEEIATAWLPAHLPLAANHTEARLHFVTHSMGGIVLRAWLREEMRRHGRPPAWLGRVVMLAPPNHGSAVVDHLRGFPPFHWFTGVNGPRLGTGSDSFPLALDPWPDAIELGVIAGTRSLNPLFSAWLAGPSDGKVTVASTQLAGQRAHLTLPYSHTWLQWRGATVRAVAGFLARGDFSAPVT